MCLAVIASTVAAMSSGPVALPQSPSGSDIWIKPDFNVLLMSLLSLPRSRAQPPRTGR